ncbi:MAG: beta-lactamase family protein [Bacteroidales bacterium]|nr:beta-lactamase family protein [Bacteroidales bacterium]
MKLIFRNIGYLLLAIMPICWASCGSSSGGQAVDIAVDSVFIDLGKAAREQRAAQADRFFNKMRNTQDLNGVVLYAEGGQVLYEKAFGWRMLNHRRDSLKTDDQFQLASVSKMFTAEAVLLLHNQGKLNINDDLKVYIPEFPYEGVTIRNLLNHRSGLSRYETLADDQWPDRGVPMHNEDLIQLYVKHQPTPYLQPNTSFHYTNVNYALLASVVERVTKQHFEDFMREQVFEPLGMTHSYIYTLRGVGRQKTYVETEVQGHDLYRSGARRVEDDYLNGVVGDKGMFSTVEDLYKFHIALENGTFLPDSLQRAAFEPGSPEWKNGDNYGFGWRLSDKHPGTVFHFGWWKGYRSFFIRDLVHGRTLIVLTNTSNGAIGDTMWEFLNDTTVMLPAASVLSLE